MAKHSQAYFNRCSNSWAVGRWNTSRAGAADSYSTYKDQATAERVAREENEREEKSADARRTITHNETVQALKDVEEFKNRAPGHPYNEIWFIGRFNSLIDQVRGGWNWGVYRDSVKAAFADNLAKPSRTKKVKSATKPKTLVKRDWRTLQRVLSNGGTVSAPADDKFATFAKDTHARGQVIPRAALQTAVERGHLELHKKTSGNSWTLTSSGREALTAAMEAAGLRPKK